MSNRLLRKVLLLFFIVSLYSCTTIKGSQELISGKEYVEQSYYKKAIDEFSKGLNKNPEHWKLYYYRGLVYQKLNETEQAINDLTVALERIAKIKNGYGKLPNDEWSKIFIERGRLYEKQGSYQLSIQDYDTAISLAPNSVAAYFYRATIKSKINQLSSAIKDYCIIIKTFPNISDSDKTMVYLGRSDVYRMQNKLKIALVDANHAVELSNNWKAFLSRGITLTKMGNLDSAIQDFNKVIDLNPSDATAYLYKASIELITNCDLEHILDNYYLAIKADNVDKDSLQLAYNQLAWIFATAADNDIRNPGSALIFAKKAVKIKPDCKNLDTLAVAFASYGKFEDAISTHKKAIKICKSNTPELLPQVERHLEYYKFKKKLKEKCPGAYIEKGQLLEWQQK
ncbi:MAG: hypothetical protein V6Z89_17120 [Desulfobacter sp.]